MLEKSWEELMNFLEIYARKQYYTETTVTNTIEESYYLVQRDTNGDGIADTEFTYNTRFTSTNVITHTKEHTDIYFQPKDYAEVAYVGSYGAGYPTEKGWEPIIPKESFEIIQDFMYELMDVYGQEQYINQYLRTEQTDYNSDLAILFRDFEAGDVYDSRFYADIFPNEIADIYSLEDYVLTAANDQGDHDSYNDIQIKIPDKKPLLDLTHELDNVPAMFDSISRYIDDEIITDNILTSLEQVAVPGLQTTLSGFAGPGISMDFIKVTPAEGVYFDNGILENIQRT